MNEINTKFEFPVRFSVMTFNVWGNHYWPARSDSLKQLILSLSPDILIIQESSLNVLQFIDNLLTSHERIITEEIESGPWITESTIYYNTKYFHSLEFGYQSFHFDEYPLRGLFWTRLELKSNTSIKFVVSTAHFPWAGSKTEISTGINQRIITTYQVCNFLREIILSDELVIFGGDFNDDFHPIRILSEELGLIDVFELLDLPPPITHPVRPSDSREETRPNRTLDWITCRLSSNSRMIATFVKNIRGGNFPPSDHLPVIAIIELTILKFN